jgi:hypothetical protein
MHVEFTVLNRLLEYELTSAERYRRYVSLVMIHSPVDPESLKITMDTHVRNSDAIAHFDHSVAVLMSETDQEDALRAVERYGNFMDDQLDPRYSVATYPVDNHTPDELLDIANRRLQEAKKSDTENRVVYEGQC